MLASAANLTRPDGEDYFPKAEQAGHRPHVTLYPLEQANEALNELRAGRFAGGRLRREDFRQGPRRS